MSFLRMQPSAWAGCADAERPIGLMTRMRLSPCARTCFSPATFGDLESDVESHAARHDSRASRPHPIIRQRSRPAKCCGTIRRELSIRGLEADGRFHAPSRWYSPEL